MTQVKGGEDLSGRVVTGTEKSADECFGGHIVRTWLKERYGIKSDSSLSALVHEISGTN